VNSKIGGGFFPKCHLVGRVSRPTPFSPGVNYYYRDFKKTVRLDRKNSLYQQSSGGISENRRDL